MPRPSRYATCPLETGAAPEDEYELALAEAHKLELPDFFWTPMMFAAIYGQMGRTKEAEQALADALKLNPDLAEGRAFISAPTFLTPKAVGGPERSAATQVRMSALAQMRIAQWE